MPTKQPTDFIVWARPPGDDGWSIVVTRPTREDAIAEAEALIEDSKGQEVTIVTQRLTWHTLDDMPDKTPCIVWTSRPGASQWQDEERIAYDARWRLFEAADNGTDVIVTTMPLPLPSDEATAQWVHKLNALAFDMDEIAASIHPSAWRETLAPLSERYCRLAAQNKCVAEGSRRALDLHALRINCADWYARPDFRAWLDQAKPRLLTLNGGQDIALTMDDLGDGLAAGMPADIRTAILSACAKHRLVYGIVWLARE